MHLLCFRKPDPSTLHSDHWASHYLQGKPSYMPQTILPVLVCSSGYVGELEAWRNFVN